MNEETLETLRWSDVRRIIAYKYDLFSYDEICVGFLTDPTADDWLEISERSDGFADAMKFVEARFPSIPDRWFWDVSRPAFVRNETVLWDAGPDAMPSPV